MVRIAMIGLYGRVEKWEGGKCKVGERARGLFCPSDHSYDVMFCCKDGKKNR
jgi:hypothetical protein